ncbi:CotH kinase family protein [Salinisphaera aquimarina]|uniref:CotH kinase family protein n=1 Tax=Salinisphaera aquimarina TaxID=2094031 RepID=A0ABV7ESG2_9GAMM
MPLFVRSPRLAVCVFLVALLGLAGCGGGGGGSDDGGGSAGVGTVGGRDTPGEPVEVAGLDANGDIVESESVYDTPPDDSIINVYVNILPPEGDACTADDGSGDDDYSGCTLSDLDTDEDGSDAFDPELQVQVTIGDDEARAAEMEVRGASTRQSRQKSYKIEFDNDAPRWFGMERLQLNKHPYDLSRVRNKVAFDLFRSVGDFTSLRTQFVHLYVTNPADPDNAGPQDFGLFTNVEYMNDDWAENHGMEEDANIFKAEQFEFLPPQFTPELMADVDSDEFETVLESKGDNEDTTVLLDMLAAITDENSAFVPAFERYFHPDNFRTWLAVNILLSNSDTNSQNFYLYRPAQIDNFYFTPWDYDGALDFVGQPSEAGASVPRWQHGLSNWWGVRLIRRYIQSGGVPALTARLDQLHASTVNADAVERLINRYPMQDIATIEASAPDFDNLPLAPDSTLSAEQQRAREIDRLGGTIAEARAQYKANLERPMPMYLEVEVVDGNVRLGWDASYDIQGDALVYDVRVSTATATSEESSRCTQQTASVTRDGVTLAADPVNILSGAGVVQSENDLTGTTLTVDRQLDPGRYYMQVVARDNKGYCQIAFDRYRAPDGSVADGILAFDWDGSTVSLAPGQE